MNKDKKILMRPKYIGKPIERFEDSKFLSGNAKYTSDINIDKMLQLVFVRSDEAHAKIKYIEYKEALKLDGIIDILTFKDFSELNQITSPSRMSNYFATYQDVVAKNKVRYVGEIIAVIVARNRYIGEDALELIDVDYESLDPVIDPEEAANNNKILLHEDIGSNVILERNFSHGTKDYIKSKNIKSVSGKFKLSRKSPIAIENRCYLSDYNIGSGNITLYSSTQIPGVIRDALSKILGIAGNKINVKALDVGGGFGGKGSLYPEEIIVTYLSKKLKKPIKWTSDRLEDFLTTSQAFEEIIEAELFFDDDGKFISLKGEVIGNIGAYSIFPWTGALEPVQVIGFLPGPYDIKNFHGNVKCVVTSKSPTGPYRGVGRPAAVFVLERLVDMAAKSISMDPFAIRMKNLIDTKNLPYRIGSGIIWNDAGFKECLEKSKNSNFFKEMIDIKNKKKCNRTWIGYGISTYAELTGIGSKISVAPGMPINTGSETATIEIDGTGSVSGIFAIASHGQGLETTLAQIIADEIGIKPEDIKITHGDTSKAKHGTGTYASRSAVIGGGAAIKTARVLKEKILKVAAYLLETDPNNIEITDGIISSLNTNKSINFSELANSVYSDMETLPVELRDSLYAKESYDPIFGATTTATHIALVEIDKQTLKVKVLKYLVSEDCGKVINPMIVDGQVHGGVAQGIGVALLEKINYDDQGQLTTANLVDYKIPTASEIPKIDVVHTEHFLPENLGQFKGMGEGGTIGAPAAIANAVADALSDYNININELPVNQEYLFQLLKNGEIR